ncbi:MAG: hypothetical protein J6A08_06630, partial [Lachnospiraceae bacterium]|nr:hypothetical protein [Lachnospiraceae bacterium]
EKREKQKKERKAKKGRKKKGSDETADEIKEQDADTLESLLEGTEGEEKPTKKPGLFAKLLAFLLEEDEDEAVLIDNPEEGSATEDLSIGSLSDENKQLLEELKEEDKKNAKKKGKKEKKKKEKKKKGKKGAEEAQEGEEAENQEENKGKSKRKKPKKKKKEKNPEEEVHSEPEKKLSKKKVISVFLFCATLAACIVVIDMILPNSMQKRDARIAYDYQKYDEVYDLLYGKKLDEEDQQLLEKSSIILQMERKLDSYENYAKMDMPLEALDALLSGVERYQTLSLKAQEYHVTDEVQKVYEQILEQLSSYGVSETDALDIIASEDNVTYSQRLESIVYGDGVSTEEGTEQLQDVLPEEEEILDRLENAEEIPGNEQEMDLAGDGSGEADSESSSDDSTNHTEAEQE